MQKDVTQSLRQIVRFLNFPVDNARIECTKRNSGKSNFHRPHKSLGFDPFDEELTEIIHRNIGKAEEVITKLRLTPLPTYTKEFI